MKKIILFLLVISAGIVTAQNKINVSYSVSLSDRYSPKGQLYSVQFMSFSDKNEIMNAFIQKVLKNPGIQSYRLPYNGLNIDFRKIGDKNIYQSNGEYFEDVPSGKLTVAGGKIFQDGKIIIDNYSGEYLYGGSDLVSSLGTIDFNEVWDFDRITGTFSKDVKLISLTAGEERKDLMGFKTSQYKGNIIASSSVPGQYNYSSGGVLVSEIFYYTDLSNLGKNMEDVYEELNMSSNNNYHYISPDKKITLLKDIINYAYNEQFVKGNNIIFSDFTCSKALDSLALKELIVKYDSVYVENIETYEPEIRVLFSEKVLSDIQGLAFNETWYFDPATFSMRKVVHGVALVEKEYPDYAEGEGESRLHVIMYIRLKNEIGGKHSPFFGKEGFILSENKYLYNDNVFSTDGKNLSGPVLSLQPGAVKIEGQENYISAGYMGDVLPAGVITGVDTLYIEDIYYGDAKPNYSPRYKYGLFDKNMKVVLPFRYKSIGEFSNGFAVISVDTFLDGQGVFDSYMSERYGAVNESGKIVAPCKYEYLEVVSSKLLKVTADGKSGLININGKQILEPIYDYIGTFVNGAARIQKDGKWGLVSSQGKLIKDCNYVYVSDFSNGRAIIYDSGMLNYVNLNGEITGPADYTVSATTSNGNKIIVVGDVNESGEVLYYENPFVKYGLVGNDGKMILPCVYTSISDMGSGRVSVVEQDGSYSIYEESGKKINLRRYNSAGSYNNGRALVSVFYNSAEDTSFITWGYYKKYGFVDVTGKEVVPLIYDQLQELSGGTSIINTNGKFGMIDNSGNEIIKPDYDYITEVGRECVSVGKDNKFGIYEKTGKGLTDIKFEATGQFKDGFIPLKTNKKWKIFNINAKRELSGEFDNVSVLSENLIMVFNGETDSYSKPLNGVYGLIDKEGKQILPVIYEKIVLSGDDLLRIKLKGKWGYADKNGRIIIKPEYIFASDFRNDIAFVYGGGKYFSIDRNGKSVANMEPGKGEEFENGHYKIYVAGPGFSGTPDVTAGETLYGVSDGNGKLIIPISYNSISVFNEFLYMLYIGEMNSYGTTKGKYGFADMGGKIVTAPVYNSITPLSAGNHLVFTGETDDYGNALKGKCGIINSSGKIIVPQIYNKIEDFEDGIYKVYITEYDQNGNILSEKFGLVSADGSVLLKPEYNSINDKIVFSGRLDENGYPLKGKYGVVDSSWKFVIPPVYDYVESMKDTMFVLFNGNTDYQGRPETGKYGFAKQDGKIISEPVYDYINSNDLYYNDKFRAFKGDLNTYGEPTYGKFGVLTADGKEILPFEFDFLADYNSGAELIMAGKRGIDPADKHCIKYGFIDRTGKVVIPFKYDDATEFSEGYSVVYIGLKDIRESNVKGKYSIINKTGKELLPFEYDHITQYKSFFIAFKGEMNYGWPGTGKYVMLDSTGTKVISSEYDKISYFAEGYYELANGEPGKYMYSIDGKHGIADKYGNIVLPVEYDAILSNYSWDYYLIEKDGKYGMTDKMFNIILPASFDYIGSYFNGVFPVRKNGKWGYVDKSGKNVTDFIYDFASSFSACEQDYYGNFTEVEKETAVVCRNNECFVIDVQGNRKAQAKYQTFAERSNGSRVVYAGAGECSKSRQFGLMAGSGSIILPCVFSDIMCWENGFVVGLSYGKNTLWNDKGIKLSAKSYTDMGVVSEGTFSLKEELTGKWGYYDTTGKEIIPFNYDAAGDFIEGKALVRSGAKYFFIDRSGKKITEKEYDFVGPFTNGVAVVFNGKTENGKPKAGKYGYINSDLKEIITPKYDEAKPFNNISLNYANVGIRSGDIIKWGTVNSEGVEIIMPGKYNFIGTFINGLALVYTGPVSSSGLPLSGKWGISDSTGKEIVGVAYDDISLLAGNVFKVFKGKTDEKGRPVSGKYGLVDEKGLVILEPGYDQIISEYYFSNYSNKIIVYNGPLLYGELPADGMYGIFSPGQKKLVVPCIYNWAGYANHDTLYKAFTGKTKMFYRGEWTPDVGTFVLFDWKGDRLTDKAYEWMEDFYNDRALVKFKGKYGYIDSTGKEIIPCIYDYIDSYGFYNSDFTDAELDGKKFKIDRNGSRVE